jgi:hypothetical protein
MGSEEQLQANAAEYEAHDRWLREQQASRVKTLSLGSAKGSKKRAMPSAPATGLRRSMSEMPLALSELTLHAVASTQSTAAVDDDNQSEHGSVDDASASMLSGRRQTIMERADEILRGKRQVGMQLGETCPVCLADDVDTQLSNCGHRVHAKCIKRWIQSGSKCPVCREVVTGVQEAYDTSSVLYFPLEKDVSDVTSSEDTSPSGVDDDDNQANEWGWFEEFDDGDDTLDEHELVKHLHSRRKHSLHAQFIGGDDHTATAEHRTHSPVMNREMSTTFEVCRTFVPLRLEYDAPYAESKHAFLRALPSHRHIAAKIQIRSFRIVESNATKTQHAEYLIELQLDRHYFSRWRRFSDLSKFVGTLGVTQFKRALAAWGELEAASRWFNRLELSYLHKRCRMLEEFAHALLQESSSAHPLADLLDG